MGQNFSPSEYGRRLKIQDWHGKRWTPCWNERAGSRGKFGTVGGIATGNEGWAFTATRRMKRFGALEPPVSPVTSTERRIQSPAEFRWNAWRWWWRANNVEHNIGRAHSTYASARPVLGGLGFRPTFSAQETKTLKGDKTIARDTGLQHLCARISGGAASTEKLENSVGS